MAGAGVPVDVVVPGDKSITHRALILAAMADGRSRVGGLLDAEDTRSTASALRALGVLMPAGVLDRAVIEGVGLDGLARPAESIDCGNSGTTARLLLGLLAGCPFDATLTGDASLRSRPMRRVTRVLGPAGAAFEELGEADRLPIRVRGRRPLGPIEHRSPRASAQVKSALLLAGLTGRVEVRTSEPWPSRDHTERMLRAAGVRIEPWDADGTAGVLLRPPDRLAPLDLEVPGDFSSAVFFLGLGALAGAVRVRGVGLNPTRTGALEVMSRMGACVEVTVEEERAGEPVGSVVVSSGPLTGTTVTAREVPALLDEVPLLAVLAARAEGETRFEGVSELRLKESDRLAAVSANLRALEVEAEAGADHLVVRGGQGLVKGRVRAYEDHRIAMAFGVLSAATGGRIDIEGKQAVGISFPRFWSMLEDARRRMEAR